MGEPGQLSHMTSLHLECVGGTDSATNQQGKHYIHLSIHVGVYVCGFFTFDPSYCWSAPLAGNLSVVQMEAVKGLKLCGQYYEGFVEGKDKLAECLESHRRDTASTFGTRTSARVDKSQENNVSS